MKIGPMMDHQAREAGPGRGISAIVLAGGRSRRFGSDKLAAQLEGQPLLHHALGAVAAVCDEIVIVGSGPHVRTALTHAWAGDLPVPLRVVADEEPLGGPLVGLVSGAAVAAHPRLLVVGGDMPSLQPAVLDRLLGWGRGHTGACLSLDGRVQPLPMGVQRRTAIEAARAAIGSGERSLRAFVAHIAPEIVPEAEWRALDPAGLSVRDIDTPEDLPRP